MSRLLWTLAILSVMATSATATTWCVPSVECPTIQAGIDSTAAGDTVLVTCGTYYEHNINMKSGVYLTSDTEPPDCVTIDAEQRGRVFCCDGVDATASIVGFTITGGHADNGGGMACDSSFPALTGCTFVGNHAWSGGGMWCVDSSPTLTDCTFEGNTADTGGGMSCGSSSPALTNCTFVGNHAFDYGGGMRCHSSSTALTGCTFAENTTDNFGGGMYCSASSPTLTACTFAENTADNYGGGMYYFTSSPTLTGCTFVGNQAGQGGGMWCGPSSPTLTACIIAFSQLGEAIYCYDATSVPVLTCCDVFGNAGGDWVGYIADQYGVDGNFSEDPLFCDMTNHDFTLAANSPCMPGGNSCEELLGAYGEGCTESPVEATSWSSIKTMYR